MVSKHLVLVWCSSINIQESEFIHTKNRHICNIFYNQVLRFLPLLQFRKKSPKSHEQSSLGHFLRQKVVLKDVFPKVYANNTKTNTTNTKKKTLQNQIWVKQSFN